MRPRFARIARVVESLLTTHSIVHPPVPVDKIARSQGIQIKRVDLHDVSGMLVREGDAVLIGVNERQPKTRQRFTVAHEFGHFLFHEGKLLHYDKAFRMNFRSEVSSKAEDIEEVEANFFAASFLMPRKFMEKDIASASFDLDDGAAIDRLAKRYDVSLQAMNIRVMSLLGGWSSKPAHVA